MTFDAKLDFSVLDLEQRPCTIDNEVLHISAAFFVRVLCRGCGSTRHSKGVFGLYHDRCSSTRALNGRKRRTVLCTTLRPSLEIFLPLSVRCCLIISGKE